MTNTFPILNQSQNINALFHSINASFTQFESPLTQSLSTSIRMYLPPCYCCISFFLVGYWASRRKGNFSIYEENTMNEVLKDR